MTLGIIASFKAIGQLAPQRYRPIRPGCLQDGLPTVRSNVKGFVIKVTRKEGCILFKKKPENADLETPDIEAGVDGHFEVLVTYDGKNPNYPTPIGPWKKFFTTSFADNSEGFVGNIHHQPYKSRYTKIEVNERFADWSQGGIIGRRPPPAMVVWLKITVEKPDGTESSFSIGLTKRTPLPQEFPKQE